MNCYVLHIPKTDSERVQLLKKAATKLKIGFKALDPYSFDFSGPSPIKKGDILYRASRGKLLQTMEQFFLVPGIKTFYKTPFVRRTDPFLFPKHDVPVPKTIFCAIKNRERLKGYIEALGGFPIVMKTVGGTHGLGVMKIESYSALFSIADYLLAQKRLLLLQQYIPVETSARFIVLGNKVISSIEYHAHKSDFRTNEASEPKVSEKKYSKELEGIAVSATHACGLEFGGVDILVHKNKPYVTEVNFPCNFARAQKIVSTDIATEMLRYLIDKKD